MSLRQKASDGTIFGVFNQGNGDYIAAEDARGFHHAPSQYASLPQWDDATARTKLRRAVKDYEALAAEPYD